MRRNARAIEDLIGSLVIALRRGDLTPEQLTQAMRLAYEHGRVDGNLELADKMLAQDVKQASLRG